MTTALDGWLGVLIVGTALGCGLIAGAFFAFSTFVMPALARLPAAQGVAAMKAINVAAITPSFMVALFGTGAGCVLLAGVSLLTSTRPGTWYLLAGSLLYLAGNIVVTMLCNVPLNNALAAVDVASAKGASLWASYIRSWTAWNHVRTVTALAAAALLTIARCMPRPGATP